jgi:2-hydroxy-3-oxopropionate reductase
VAHADLVLTMLADGSVVGEVIEQAWPGLRTGVLVVDMSSTRQDEAQQLQARLAQRQVRFVDAPVSGGVAGAAAGTLAIMAGAAPEDFEAARPVFDCLGRATLVGAVGCGQLAKLCNQLIVGGTLNIVAEALLLAQAGGADPAAVRAALRGGFADSRVLEVHGQRMLERDFMPGGQVKSQLKDLENTLLAAHAAALKLPVTELVTARYRTLLAQVPQADQAAALLALEQLNPAWRLGSGPDRLP